MDQIQLLEDEEPKPRRQTFEPRTRKDFVKVMAHITKRDGKTLAILTSHWPKDLRWHYEVASLVKYEKDSSKHAVIINSFIKQSKTKEIK